MNFDQSEQLSAEENKSKNRKTLLLLLAMFIAPVLLAYAAFFGNWFSGPKGAQGELIQSDLRTDIEDYALFKKNGKAFTGKEFETLYWWIIPIDPNSCDQACVNLNLHVVHQTYLGLGKEASRINELAIIEANNSTNRKPPNVGVFPTATSLFSQRGVKAVDKTHSGKGLDLPSNYIYLVDPLGNIFMRYPLIDDKEGAPLLSGKLRKDILHLFKYSRLG